MRYIRKISDYAIAGGIGAIALFGLVGCEDKDAQNVEYVQKQGAFVIIEEVAKGEYKILEEYPSDITRIVLKELNGTERILSQSEIDNMLKEAEKKINSNTSALTNPQMSNGGLSLGEVILGSAAGMLIGSWIGSKLFGNQNYQNQRQAGYKSPQTYSKSVDSFNKAKTTGVAKTSSTKSGGFFGGGSKGTSSSSSYGG